MRIACTHLNALVNQERAQVPQATTSKACIAIEHDRMTGMRGSGGHKP